MTGSASAIPAPSACRFGWAETCAAPTEILARIWHRLLVERRLTRIWPNPRTGPRLSVSAGQSLFCGYSPSRKHLGATAFQGGAFAWGCNRALSSVSAGQSPFRLVPPTGFEPALPPWRASQFHRIVAGQRRCEGQATARLWHTLGTGLSQDGRRAVACEDRRWRTSAQGLHLPSRMSPRHIAQNAARVDEIAPTTGCLRDNTAVSSGALTVNSLEP